VGIQLKRLTGAEQQHSDLTWQQMLANQLKIVTVRKGPHGAALPKRTLSCALLEIEAASQPAYTGSIFTFDYGVRYFSLQGDLLPSVRNFRAKEGPAVACSEDVVGSAGSYSAWHLDDAPCTANCVTVIGPLGAIKEMVGLDFDLQRQLPAGFPVAGRDDGPIDADTWGRLVEHVLAAGGWHAILGPGGRRCVPSSCCPVKLHACCGGAAAEGPALLLLSCCRRSRAAAPRPRMARYLQQVAHILCEQQRPARR
jgi:hypothetical protein